MNTEPARPGPLELDVAALLFDNDGVLVDSVDAGNRAWRQWAQEHDLDEERVLEMIHGRRAQDTVMTLLPADQVAVATDRINELELGTASLTTALPGAAALLGSLAGVRWAVATSATRPLALARLRAAGLPLPDVLVSAEEVEAGKPAPDPYLTAADRLGADAGDCVVFEDSGAGVDAGVAAGAHVVAIGLADGVARGAVTVVGDLGAVGAQPRGERVRLVVG